MQSAPADTFDRSYPTKGTTQRDRDDADYERALIAYRFWYPAVSLEGFFNGMREIGVQDNHSLGLGAATPHWVAFTANSDTPYALGALDLRDSPMVVEIPPGPFVSVVDDHNQRWVVDMGLPGPDKGQGGKYLIVPPGYQSKPPAGYRVVQSSTYKNLIVVRSIPQNGDIKTAMEKTKTVKVYPLANPSKLVTYVDVTGKNISSTSVPWEDSIQYWQRLREIIDNEPVLEEYRPMYGVLMELGIMKGKPFDPDPRIRAILERAARDGKAQMLVAGFDSPRQDRITWKDRHWEWAALSADPNFETNSGIDLEARDRWFMQALAVSPAMFSRSPGAGSLYWLAVRDENGDWLDGGKTYKLTIPEPVPHKLFWSVTVYDAGTRSQIQTDQEKAALRSMFELKDVSTTQPTELYFGPQAPAGKENVWIKTIPGKGWFTYFRIYGPEGPAFDGSWKPGDFQETK